MAPVGVMEASRLELRRPTAPGSRRYSELLRALLRREIRASTGLGSRDPWSYVNPLLMMGVYTLVFSVLWKAVSIEHYPLFVLSGLVVWVFFQAGVQTGTGSLVANANLITKIWFPREVIPIAVVLAQAISARGHARCSRSRQSRRRSGELANAACSPSPSSPP